MAGHKGKKNSFNCTVNILITFTIIVEMLSENGVMNLDYKSECSKQSLNSLNSAYILLLARGWSWQVCESSGVNSGQYLKCNNLKLFIQQLNFIVL